MGGLNLFIISFSPPPSSFVVYEFTVFDLQRRPVCLDQFRQMVVLVVNVASFAPNAAEQYEQLEQLQREFGHAGFAVLAFPCNQFGGHELLDGPVIGETVAARLGAPSVAVFDKVRVNGTESCQLFTYLKGHAPAKDGALHIANNFTKFLVAKDGQVFQRYEPEVPVAALRDDVRTLLTAQAVHKADVTRSGTVVTVDMATSPMRPVPASQPRPCVSIPPPPGTSLSADLTRALGNIKTVDDLDQQWQYVRPQMSGGEASASSKPHVTSPADRAGPAYTTLTVPGGARKYLRFHSANNSMEQDDGDLDLLNNTTVIPSQEPAAMPPAPGPTQHELHNMTHPLPARTRHLSWDSGRGGSSHLDLTTLHAPPARARGPPSSKYRDDSGLECSARLSESKMSLVSRDSDGNISLGGRSFLSVGSSFVMTFV